METKLQEAGDPEGSNNVLLFPKLKTPHPWAGEELPVCTILCQGSLLSSQLKNWFAHTVVVPAKDLLPFNQKLSTAVVVKQGYF